MRKKDNIFFKTIKQTPFFVFSIKSCICLILCMSFASVLCYFISQATDTNSPVALIFVLAVFLTSLLTEGYFYGILAAVISVFAVNWAFTYPYGKLNFSIYGYPITFITMLTVGIATSSLTTIQKKQDELKIEKEKEEIRSALLRSISHDLRTPLTAIIGDMELIQASNSQLDDASKQIVIDAKDNASWLRKIIENVLSITRVGNNPSDIKKTGETVDDLLEDVISKFKRTHQEVTVKSILPEEIFTVPVDILLVEQLFWNLMDNAVQHGKANEILIRAIKQEDKVLFQIDDNGKGIEKNILPHLFDGSLQLINNDKNRYMGIGLMVCKTIVEAHDGQISAENLSKGARFSFTLGLKNYGY